MKRQEMEELVFFALLKDAPIGEYPSEEDTSWIVDEYIKENNVEVEE